MLSSQEILLITIILVTLVLIVSDRLHADLVAILVLLMLPLIGIITYQEVFSSFSRSAVITIVQIFIITQALEDMGMGMQWVAAFSWPIFPANIL